MYTTTFVPKQVNVYHSKKTETVMRLLLLLIC